MDEGEEMSKTKEEIYDEQIFPLMAKVIEICQANRIAFIFDAALGYEDEETDSQLKCTSCLLEDDCEPPDEMIKAYYHIRPKRAVFAAFTIKKTEG